MAVRKTGRRARVAERGRRRRGGVRWWSALVGGLLICAALGWFGWLVVSQQHASLSFRFPFTNVQNQPTAQPSVDPLVAAGISLATPGSGQTALLSQQQAIVLANQLEPQAAAHARGVSTAYVLFSYKGSTPIPGGLSGVPAWLVHYSKVAAAGPDTAADPHAANSPHDCYLFLDATSGKELLAVWT